MAISYRGASNAAGQASGSAGASTVSITPTLPSGAASGDRVYVYAVGTTTSGTTPANWNVVGTKDTTLGSGAAAAGTGLRRATWYWRDYNGVWTMPAFTLTSTANNSHWVGAVAITPTAGSVFDTPTTTTVGGAFNAATTSYTDSSAASFTTTTNGFLLVGTGLNDNVTSSAAALSQTGATFGTVTERCDGGTGTGFTVSGKIHTAPVTTGASATITHTQTIGSSQGETLIVQQTETALSAVATLTDDFGSEDGAKWTGYASANVGVVSGELSVTGNNDTLVSVNSYNLTGSSAYVKVVSAGFAFQFSVYDGTFLGGPLSKGALFAYDGVDLIYIAGDGSTGAGTVTYNATSHKWLRIRESGGSVFWDVAPDGSTWTNLSSVAFPATGVKVEFAGDSTLFDNFNTPGGASLTGAASLAVTAAPTSAAARTHNASASLAVTATPTGVGTLAATGNTSLAVTTGLTAAATRTHNATASLAETATPTGAVTNAGVVDAALPVTATPTSVGSRNQDLTASLPVTATPAAAITRSVTADSSLAATATITAAGEVSKTVTAALPVTASRTAAASLAATAAASLAVTASVTATADKIVESAASLAVTAAPTSAATRTANVQASLPVTATITSAGARDATVNTNLGLDAQTSAAATKSISTAASLPCTATITAACVVSKTLSASLAVTATLTAGGSIPVRTDDSRVTVINPDLRITTIAETAREVIVARETRETHPDREPALIGAAPRTSRMD